MFTSHIYLCHIEIYGFHFFRQILRKLGTCVYTSLFIWYLASVNNLQFLQRKQIFFLMEVWIAISLVMKVDTKKYPSIANNFHDESGFPLMLLWVSEISQLPEGAMSMLCVLFVIVFIIFSQFLHSVCMRISVCCELYTYIWIKQQWAHDYRQYNAIQPYV